MVLRVVGSSPIGYPKPGLGPGYFFLLIAFMVGLQVIFGILNDRSSGLFSKKLL